MKSDKLQVQKSDGAKDSFISGISNSNASNVEGVEVPQEVIEQFGKARDMPAGHIKVDQSGFYMARALDSASEMTPTPDQSSVIKSVDAKAKFNESSGLNRTRPGQEAEQTQKSD